ncbi:MAG TPA: hypothetical protein VGO50_00305 [Pyrinomonadaceae bacterium]|nr:hypothetical protein [Pyrinomonadaceae bacterium]
MSELKKWTYNIALCHWIKTSGGLFQEEEGYWVIDIEKELPLAEGLNYAGELGYELVGLQIARSRFGGELGGYEHPDHLYIFKKPLTQQSEDAPE